MTIGRTDILLPYTVPPAVALERAVRCAMDLWPEAFVTDGEDTTAFPSVDSIPFAGSTELMVFRSSQVRSDIRRSGITPDTANGMVNFIVDADEITIVVDDRADPAMQALVAAIRPQLVMPARLATPDRERVAS